MLELYFDRRGEVALENLADLMDAFPQFAGRAIASAMRSEGYRLRGIMQDAIAGGGPGKKVALGTERSWPVLNPHTGVLAQSKRRITTKDFKNYKMVWKGKKGSKKRVAEYKQVILSTRQDPLLRLRGGIRYAYDPETQLLTVGFVNQPRKVLRWVHAQAEGYSVKVTPRMRKYFFAIGFPLKKTTTTLRVPPRPLVEPIFRAEKDQILANIRQKFTNNVLRYMVEGKRARLAA